MFIKRRHCRRSIRLKRYDYSQPGMYFVTICAQNNECVFGETRNEEMILNELGKFVDDFWQKISEHFDNVNLDEYIIMPNHLHGIIFIDDNFGRGAVSAPLGVSIQILNQNKGWETQPLRRETQPLRRETQTLPTETLPLQTETPPLLGRQTRSLQPTLGQIIGYYKYQTTKRINGLRNTPNIKFWQRNYYEHIIRNEFSLNKIREYIYNNPGKWLNDMENSRNNYSQEQIKKIYNNLFK